MLHVALLRLVQDAGLEGGLDQAGADNDVEAALVVAQARAGLELPGTWSVENQGPSVVTLLD